MRRIFRAGPGLLVCLCLLVATAAAGQEKRLSWRAMDVRAKLDSDGRLHVTERQAMVFTGEWNGGERIFNVRPGQSLKLEGLWRVDPATDEKKRLSEGSLSEVDRYGWTDTRTLRWRSRRPSDPTFSDTEIDYEIAYTLSGVLLRQGDTYLLDHDFAFPDRAGPIESFSLDLELDPVWQPQKPWPGRLTRGRLPPGQGVVVTLPLTYRGAARPAAARSGTTPGERRAVFGLLLAGMVAMYAVFRRREAALGRCAPGPTPGAIDPAWLEKNVFTLRPEEVGALWDENIGAPEVAAVLARLTEEKKIETKAEGKKKLTLRLLAPLDHFSGYEKELVEALFLGGDETDTDKIKAHYRSKGFDPAAKIKDGLESKLARHPDFQDRSMRPPRWPSAVLISAGTLILVLSAVTKTEDPSLIVGLLIFHAVVYAVGLPVAYVLRKRVDSLDLHSIKILWVPVLFLYFSWKGIALGGQTGLLLLVGLLLLRLGIANNIFNVAKTRDGPKKIARRKLLTAAREFFKRELASRQPNLDDRWYPYVIAFGLGSAADRWFRAYGAPAAAASAGRVSSGSSSSPASGSSGSWTGGGGAFGGAGASASWAAAAGAIASGVATPGSGGSGGGGGGGGGSSGGGGGGGW
jgi:uncharacterized membrane protein YgcG